MGAWEGLVPSLAALGTSLLTWEEAIASSASALTPGDVPGLSVRSLKGPSLPRRRSWVWGGAFPSGEAKTRKGLLPVPH